MAVIVTPNASSVKITFYHGVDLDGNKINKTKTLSNVKSSASNDDIMAVVNAISNLQQHSVTSIIKVDNTTLSE